MQVACPRCSTENEIDETEQAADGRVRMRCSNCNAKLLIKVNRPDLKLNSDIPETPDDEDNDVGTASVRLAPLDQLEIELGDEEEQARDEWHVLVVHELEWKRIGDFRRALLGLPKFKRNPNKMQDVTSEFPYIIQELAPEGLAKLTTLLEGASSRWETGSKDALLDTQGNVRTLEQPEAAEEPMELSLPADTSEEELPGSDEGEADLVVAGDDEDDIPFMAGDDEDDIPFMAGDEDDDIPLMAGDEGDHGFLAGGDSLLGPETPDLSKPTSASPEAPSADGPEVTQDTYVVEDEEDDGSDAAAEALFGPAIIQDKVPAIERKAKPHEPPVENLAASIPPKPPPPPPPVPERRQTRPPARPLTEADIVLSTLTTRRATDEDLGYISALVVLSAGDLASRGDSVVTQAILQVRGDLRKAALKRGANAVGGVRTTPSTAGGSWMVLIEGTAIRRG